MTPIIARGISYALSEAMASPMRMVQTGIASYTVLHAAASYFHDHNPKLYALYHKVQDVFTFVGGVLALFEVGYATSKLFNFSDAPEASNAQGLTVVLCSFVCAGVSFLIHRIAQRILQNDDINSELRNQAQQQGMITANQNICVSGNEESSEGIQMLSMVGRAVATVALALLAAQPPLLCGINLVCLGYSYWKTSKQKWLKLTREFHLQLPSAAGGMINGIAARYILPLIPDDRPEQEDCLICLDNANTANNPKIYFCSDKSYHVQCLPALFAQHLPRVLNGLQLDRQEVTTQYYSGGLPHTSTTVSYPASIPRTNLPTCPDCRRDPTIDHQLYFTIHSSRDGDCESLVTLR